MVNLMDYRKEIGAISRKNDVDLGVARDMFLANIRNVGDDTLPYYPGADEVNYAELQATFPKLGTQEYADMCNDFSDKI